MKSFLAGVAMLALIAPAFANHADDEDQEEFVAQSQCVLSSDLDELKTEFQAKINEMTAQAPEEFRDMYRGMLEGQAEEVLSMIPVMYVVVETEAACTAAGKTMAPK